MARSTQDKINSQNVDINALISYSNTLTGMNVAQEKHEIQMQILAKQKIISELEIKKIKEASGVFDQNAYNQALKNQKNLEKQIDLQKNIIKNQINLVDVLTKNYWYQNALLKTLNDQDKVIRQTVLNLGLSGDKAFKMRQSFETAASNAFNIGATLEDILKTQTGFADETGRAQVLTNDMINDVLLIGKGTAMGVEQATKLASQFQLMGVDTKSTMQYVQGVVDTSERMGINTTKVLNNIANNFKKLQTMNFASGVQGYAKMAEYAEQMKIDMAQSLESNKMANNLEKSIDLAAQLQVMGGEFSKIDPFQMLYLSRNAPEEFQKRMNEMTKGLVTFRKMTDGTFEKFISPLDRDRLEAVAKATNKTVEELTNQALRMADVDRMKQSLLGKGFSAKDKELITGQAIFDNKLGKYLVSVGGVRKDITQLTDEDMKSLDVQTASLKQRAEDAMTFNETMKAMGDELKSILLPFMRNITWALTGLRGFINDVTHFFGEGFSKVFAVVGAIGGAVLLGQTFIKIGFGDRKSVV